MPPVALGFKRHLTVAVRNAEAVRVIPPPPVHLHSFGRRRPAVIPAAPVVSQGVGPTVVKKGLPTLK
jgi:hypothetical protein